MKLSNCQIVKLSKFLCFFVLVFSCFHVLVFSCFAQQEATPTASQSQMEKIRDLKERVATKVAELKEKKKRAYLGKIKKISDSVIFLTTPQEEITVKTDQTEKFFQIKAGEKEEIELEDLSSDQQITVFGLVEDKEITANLIIAQKMPLMIWGQVVKTDAEQGTVTIQTPSQIPAGVPKGEFVVDYEVSTYCRLFDDQQGLIKGGFSKINVADRVHVIASPGEEENRVTALRILIIPGKVLGITAGLEASPEPSPSPSPSPTE